MNKNHLSLYFIDDKMLLEVSTYENEQWNLVEKTWDFSKIAKYIRKLPKNITRSIYCSNILDLFFEDNSSITIYDYPEFKRKFAFHSLKRRIDKPFLKSKRNFYTGLLLALGIMSGVSSVAYSSENVSEEANAILADIETNEEILNDILKEVDTTSVENSVSENNLENVDDDDEIIYDDVENAMSVSKDVDEVQLSVNDTQTEILDEAEYNFQEVLTNFGSNANDKRITHVKSTLQDILNKYSNIIGIDPIILECLIAQESGTATANEMSDDGAFGRGQIQYNIHINSTKSLYDVNTGQEETFVVTDDMLMSDEGNIKVCASILQNNLIKYNGNIFIALQAYNFGPGAMDTVLKMTADDAGYSVDELINDPTNLCWLTYAKTYSEINNNHGDPDFLNHLFGFYYKDTITTDYKAYSKNGENVTYRVKSYQKSMSR